MKFRISLFLLTLGLAALSTLTAYARPCSNQTLKGTYANSPPRANIPSDVSAPLVLTGVVKATYDGKGTFTPVDAVA